MSHKIQVRRGLKSAMPLGSSGEPLFATDTRELFMGTGNGNVNMSGSHWYRGTAMSDTSTTTGAYSFSACPEVKLDDIYMNTSNGNIYACTTAGKGSAAKWTYQGCIKGNTGATGAAGKNGTNAATYVVTTDSEFEAALNNLPSDGGKIIVREGSYNIENHSKKSCIIIEGMGKEQTTILYQGWYPNDETIIIKDATVVLSNDKSYVGTNDYSKTSFVFENCFVLEGHGDEYGDEIYNGTGNLTFLNSELEITTIMSSSNVPECNSGIAKAGVVSFIASRITIDSGQTYKSGYDCNLIYECDEYDFCNTKITCKGQNNINLVYKGRGDFNGGSIICGNSKHNICHYDSNVSRSPQSRFIGVYVEYYATYMAFATISGCVFNHKAVGAENTNMITLLCTTDISNNRFLGSVSYINGNNKTHIVSHNMTSCGIKMGSMASGSVADTSDNIQY